MKGQQINTAPLHDIGKIGIPDKFSLNRTLTAEEYEVKKHTTLGQDALLRPKDDGRCGKFLVLCPEIAYSHHESGWYCYPQGLAGRKYPAARLMALVDAYDA